MYKHELDRRTWLRIAGAAGAVVLFLAFYVEDWGRDFTAHEAQLTADASDELMRPLVVTRSLPEMVVAVKMAAHRIRNWEFTGEAADGDTVALYFVRQNRLLRIRDDIIVTLEDLGNTRAVHATSRARLHIGDLGRNPRNLKRFMSELRTVLDGAGHDPPLGTGPPDYP